MITKYEWKQIEDALLLSAHQLKLQGIALPENAFMAFAQAFTLKFFGEKNFNGEMFTAKLKVRFDEMNS